LAAGRSAGGCCPCSVTTAARRAAMIGIRRRSFAILARGQDEAKPLPRAGHVAEWLTFRFSAVSSGHSRLRPCLAWPDCAPVETPCPLASSANRRQPMRARSRIVPPRGPQRRSPHLVIRQFFERAHHRRVVPLGASARRARVEQLLRGCRVRQRDAQRARA